MAVEQEHLLRRLMFIRHIYENGCRQAEQPFPYSTACLLNFHDAVELFIQLGLEHHDAEEKREFIQCYDSLKAKVGELSGRESIKRLNDARVTVKHRGIEISDKEVSQARSRTTSFLEENCPILFQIEFDNISQISHINHSNAKLHLKNAQTALNDGNFQECIKEAAIAFALFRTDNKVFRNGMIRSNSKDQEAIATVANRLNLHLNLLSLGIDPKRFQLFEFVTPHIFVSMAGTTQTSFKRTSFDEKSARFAFDFAIECITRVEAWKPEI